jgi:type VI secretion system lysozyme-like protein
MSTLIERVSSLRPPTYRESILRSVRRLCDTRAGTVREQPDFGLPHASEIIHRFPDAADALAATLQLAMDRHEPRLSQVVVTPLRTAETVARFDVVAQLTERRGSEIQFEISLDPSHSITVK